MAPADAGDLLRESGLRVTPQRRAILGAFRGGAAEHLSADEVHARASAAVPEIGRGTVYATLAELTELGLLGSVGNPEPVRYETNLAAHDHFRCRLCMRLFDVDLGGGELADRSLRGFRIEQVSIMAEGICADCHEYERGLRQGAAEVLDRPLLAADALDELACRELESPLGDLALAASSHGIVRIAFSDHADFAAISARAGRRGGPNAGHIRCDDLGRVLTGYFDGSREAMGNVIDWRLSTAPVAAALTATARIPFGESLSYERVDTALSAYACGRAMGANPAPLLTPCHRVSRGSERPEVYVGGLDRLRYLRALEAQSA